MSAHQIIRRLLEQDDEPLQADPLGPYVGPVEFQNNIAEIVKHAEFLKSQAAEAGALTLIQKQNVRPEDIDRAFMLVALEHFGDTYKGPARIAAQLKREMHSIWS